MKHTLKILAILVFSIVISLPASAPRAEAARGENLIANPSFEDVSGGMPMDWGKGMWGVHDAAFSYPVSGYNSDSAARVSIGSHRSGDAKWYFNDVDAEPLTAYTFSDYWNSEVRTIVTVRYTLLDDTYTYVDLAVLPAKGVWDKFEHTFTTPANVKKMTVFHLLNRPGTLTVDDYSLMKVAEDPSKFEQGMVSLNFDDGLRNTLENALPIVNEAGLRTTHFVVTGYMNFPGYMNSSEIVSLEEMGHEIGGHSKSHANLTVLSDEDMHDEIAGAKDILTALGLKITSFAYPFGAYSTKTDGMIKSAGFTNARITDGGFNNKNENAYLLERRRINEETTFEMAKAWIDHAVSEKVWEVLVFHGVDDSGAPNTSSPALLQQIVDYLVDNNIKVVTMDEGARIMAE